MVALQLEVALFAAGLTTFVAFTVYFCSEYPMLVQLRIALPMSALAFVIALVSMPILRSLPMQQFDVAAVVFAFVSVYCLAMLTAVMSLIGLFRVRQPKFLIALLTSMIALALFHVNIATDLIWPFRS